MHTYVDNVLVKTKQSGTLMDVLKETFANLQRYCMKLNPEKCTFGVPAEQFLVISFPNEGSRLTPRR
jgi:hypothetical protein